MTHSTSSSSGTHTHSNLLREWDHWFGVIAVVALWTALAWLFGYRQEIWVDEATQLSGLTLSPTKVLSWLAGVDQGRFDVPGDRMPPLSYWLGWLWAQLFGLTEHSMRAFSAIITGTAIVVTMTTARKHWGRGAGYWVAAAFVLSPNVITMGVEIRAYPLLLLTSACSFAFLLRIHQGGTQRLSHWIGLVLCCAAAIYTHFFGLLLSGAVCLAAMIVTWSDKRYRYWSFVASAVVFFCALGLLPFVRAALVLSPTSSSVKAPTADLVRGLVRLAFRILGGHPSARVVPPFTWAVLAGTAATLAIGGYFNRKSKTAAMLLIAVGSGLVVACLTKVFSAAFDALSISYNTWLLPAVALLQSSAFAVSQPLWRRARGIAAVLFVGGSLGSTATLLVHAPHFAHSAGDRVAQQVDAMGGPEQLVVILDGKTDWGIAYFPLRFRFGARLRQYLTSGNESPAALLKLPHRDPAEFPKTSEAKELWVVAGHTMDSEALVADISGHGRRRSDDSSLASTLESAGWRRIGTDFLPALGAIGVTRYAAR